MTDRQIIIDGVDVSGCNFTLERDGKIKCECTHATGFGVICDCESWKTCDYKNYKRKEQECERLKQGYAELTEIVSPYMGDFTGYNEELGGFDIVLCVKQLLEQLDQLKAENEWLKEEFINKNEKIKELRFSVSDLTNRLCDLNAEKSFKIVDLEQALEKVREFAKSYMQDCDFSWGCDACDYKCFAQHIQQTCDEAKNGQIKQISQ